MLIPDATTLAAWGTGLGTFLASFAGAAYAVMRKVRNGAVKKAADDHRNVQQLIDAAVVEERRRQAELSTLQASATEAWRELAQARQAKIDEYASEIAELKRSLAEVRKTNGVLSKATAQQTIELNELRGQLEQLRAQIAK